jgi:NAD(P)-dependent dehydrogenase (short-subunit alcohol dehydrogenase family)
MDISGTAALVTGGASGLGEATARALASLGADVTIVDLNEEAGDALFEETDGAIKFVAADVTDPDAIQDAVDLASAREPLRIAINCAGIAIGERTLDRGGNPADLARFARVLQVNLIGSYNVAAHAAAEMGRTDPLAHGERGVIINTASIAAFDGQIGQTAYAASKGAIVGMTLPMARDLSAIGIRVNTIAPGIVRTSLLGELDEDTLDRLAANVPFPKRLGAPEDFAKLVLAIIDNGYMNGETIRMDGALRMPPR